jgi:hypothetical protein
MAEVDLLIKLFDTLKDASKETRDLCQAMLINQNNIGNYIKTLPMADLTQALKEHANQSTSEIGSCTETVESTTDTILEEIRTLKQKVKTMITVVIVAFTLFGTALLIGGIVTKTDVVTHSSLEKIIKDQNVLIEDLRKQIENLHGDNKKTK